MEELKLDKDQYYEAIYRAAKENDGKSFRKLFLRLHDRDQHEVFHLLYPDKKQKIANFLSPEEFSELFEWMSIEDQEYVVNHFPESFVAKLFNEIPTDDVVKFLKQTPNIDRRYPLDLMDDKKRTRVEELLSYQPETAGSIMTKEFVSVNQSQTASEVIAFLRQIGNSAETIYYIYVLDNKANLVGVLSLRDLILAPADGIVQNAMSNQVATVPVDMDQEEVARVIQNYDLLAVPVVDDGDMLGIVTVDDVMDILESEVTEDFRDFAAIRRNDGNESKAKEEGAIQTAKERAPWIIVLIFLGMITGGLISFFEETLESVVLLAAFIPMIMDTAGNVGTQSLAVSVRNLNVEKDEKHSLWQTVKKEFGSGILIGIAAAIALFLVAVVFYQNTILAFIVSISVLLTISFSTVVGAVIPAIAVKLNIDPAVASGPFITTINDALGLMIYFSIATSLLHVL
ncbi:magnesium transporter [Tetragenococcus koreensis]|uniref:Magnesium transporter MgtE n=1 Tax=Tetragenococcus koreensis TaxID=290335 RepID=A0AAN4UC15_9ENTE|nr:magnesium transporter [Tetragenococcus koreensis]MDN6730321.1 magnesium transporter [Alkalibacterium sp.]AYW45725.1 magnesium transporter [Tetragenococcus koreensis]MCF1585531.1 magnesium transporter [Tetragenococcus koreensis]MCF1615077.1 magnesium transporter [Tetragenococcus koreensis]MCF1616913.1 magnesium transporter [Tetragenococcus koreensis]